MERRLPGSFCDIIFYTGGSGLAEHVGRLLAEKAMADRDADVDVSGEACGKEEACGREKCVIKRKNMEKRRHAAGRKPYFWQGVVLRQR